MGMSIASISLTGLNTALAGIRTTQHNIANASTPGYHRQDIRQSASLPEFYGGNFYGTGVEVDNVVRMYNRFLDNELRGYDSQLASSEAYSFYAGEVDALLGATGTSLDSAVQKFFASVNEVANNPTSMATREQMLSQGKNLVGRVRLLGERLDSLSDAINQEVQTSVTQINAYIQKIAQVNGAIGDSRAVTQEPNDLLDQRDQLINELNKLVNVSQIPQSDGTVAVFMSNGQALVVGSAAQTLVATRDPEDATQITVAVEAQSGGLIHMNTDQISGGRLGGLLSFREDILNPSRSDLGRVAVALSAQFNAQHVQGFDLTGAAGVNFFTAPSLHQPMANTDNAGTAPTLNLTLSNAGNIDYSDYVLSYDSGTYSMVRESDGVTVGTAPLAGGTINFDGLSLSIAGGAPANGDRWRLRPFAFAASGMSMGITDARQIAAAGGTLGVSNGPGDSANALSLAALQTQASMSGATATYSAAYNQLVSRNAIHAGGAETDVTTYTHLKNITEESQQSVSGVNLDEEAARLIQYQQAYQAAAKAIQIASTLFDELLAIR